MIVSQQLPLSPLLQDLFSRCFMIFLLFVALLLWRSRGTIGELFDPALSNKRYLRHAMNVALLLVPVTVFTTALIGLMGYINFAWMLSRYQVYMVMLLIGYILGRGLILDILDLISEWMIKHLKNGWLWVEVFLKPLDKILRMILLVLCLFALTPLFDSTTNSMIWSAIIKTGYYPLVNFSGFYITPFSILSFIIVLFIFIWAAQWTRELCYRWLFRDARDAAIRNSLSIFTQYAVILLGGFITLRVLGLDFSGMSMILGGLAVGMGFGLRDFASNIVGGIMLLIERPVREGDLVSISGFEGRVAHIGIRSMRVCSWDNMEVLIPNAETFNKPFTNWTHQDSIVRTVVPIKISREDDPNLVQGLIADVLALIPEIIPDPPPQVFLKQIDNALIEFEIRYFINVDIHTRFEVRSKVLFAIMARFNEANIKAPITPLSVAFMKEELDDYISNDKPA